MSLFASVMGSISVFNFIVKLNDMMAMKKVLTIAKWWAGAVLGAVAYRRNGTAPHPV